MKNAPAPHKAFSRLVIDTYRAPVEVADYLKTLSIGLNARLYFAALTMVLNLFTFQLGSFLGLFPEFFPGLSVNLLAALQGIFFIAMIFFAYYGGRWFQGTGSFAQTVLLISWAQFALLWLSLLQIIFFFTFPPIAFLVGLAAFFYTIILNVAFIMRLHGFSSAVKTTIGCFIGFLGILFLLALVLEILLGTQNLHPSEEMLNNAL